MLSSSDGGDTAATFRREPVAAVSNRRRLFAAAHVPVLLATLAIFPFAAQGEIPVTAGSSLEAPAPGSLLPGAPDQWELTWSEEFDGPDAELDTRWVSQNGPSGHILSSRWRENAVVSDGTLKLINRKEQRGGQQWTSGNIWTREKFLYGYFECRYKYAAAEGTNNSFWLMTQHKKSPEKGASFEIDINEGHFPNEVNTNIHNWSAIKVVKGKRTHPSFPKAFAFGARPDVTIPLETPITTRKIRLTSTQGGHFHIGEVRFYAPNAAGFPDALSPTADQDKPDLVNYARDSSTTISTSGFLKEGQDTSARLVDGKPTSTWISQKEGDKWVEFEFPEDRTIGCIQFLNGWLDRGNWNGLLSNYRVEYHNGKDWVEVSTFDLLDGEYNFARDYQVYGLEWTPEELIFYFNGKEIRRVKNEFCYSESPIWLSLAIIPWGGKVTDAIDGTKMEVDYVRVYKRR